MGHDQLAVQDDLDRVQDPGEFGQFGQAAGEVAPGAAADRRGAADGVLQDAGAVELELECPAALVGRDLRGGHGQHGLKPARSSAMSGGVSGTVGDRCSMPPSYAAAVAD
jgi:hypothetical protein